MSTVSTTGTVNGTTTQNGPVLGTAGGDLGENQFLTLLTTELKNQDPTQPVDDTAMVAQLAQFSSLEQMQQLNTQFAEFSRNSALNFGYLAAGQQVNLTLTDGSTASGTLSSITFDSTNNNQMVLNVGGQTYESDSIARITNPALASTSNPSQTTQ
jgi:flagellar basal-body rod modification protein FlgD